MKILGKAENGDLIIQITIAEFEKLKSKRDVKRRYQQFKLTEMGKFFESVKGQKIIGRGQCSFMWLSGRIDGTITELEDIANGDLYVKNMGAASRQALKNALNAYLQKPNNAI